MSAKELKQRLKISGFKQLFVAEALDISKYYLNDVLNGRKPLTKRLQVKLEYFLEVNK